MYYSVQRYNKKVERGMWKEKNLRFLIKKRSKILSVQENVVPLHPQNGTRMF